MDPLDRYANEICVALNFDVFTLQSTMFLHYRSVHLFPIEPSLDDELDIVIQPQLEHCVSIHQNAWMGKLNSLYFFYAIFL